MAFTVILYVAGSIMANLQVKFISLYRIARNNISLDVLITFQILILDNLLMKNIVTDKILVYRNYN